MRYEEALLDANLALKIVPDCLDAYHLLSDCLIATSKFSEAAKILNIMAKNNPEDAGLQRKYEMISQSSKAQASNNPTYY